MSIPIDMVLRFWRGGEFPVSVDDLLRLRDEEVLEPEELGRLEAELLAIARHKVLMDPRLGYHVVEAYEGDDFELFVVAACDEDWACFYAWEETGWKTRIAGVPYRRKGDRRFVVLRAIKSTSQR
jgi:hypothetical protein